MPEENDAVYWAAQAAALKYLGTRLKTAAEVEKKLQDLDFDPDTCAAVLDFLRRYGYVDDAKVARAYIRDCARFHPRGWLRLQRELTEKGVAPAIITAALEEARDTGALNEEGAAYALVAKKAPDLRDLREKRRMASFLERRGYRWETIRRALERWEEESGAAAPEEEAGKG